MGITEILIRGFMLLIFEIFDPRFSNCLVSVLLLLRGVDSIKEFPIKIKEGLLTFDGCILGKAVDIH